MKRFYVHVSVDDLDANVKFYSTVFGAPPTVVKRDYAKGMVDDPRINFAISKRGSALGVDHLGVQVDSDEELSVLRARVKARGGCRARPVRRGVLLCALRQILDHRSAGNCVGNFPHPRFNSSLRRHVTRADERLLRGRANRRIRVWQIRRLLRLEETSMKLGNF